MELLFGDDEFLIAVKNTLIIAGISGPVGYFASLAVAWFINDITPRLRPLMVLFFYAPSISGGAFMIWQLMFSGDAYGYANSILMYFKITNEPIQWFTNTKYMLPLVIAVQIWMSLGAGFLSFVAGLRGIDRSYYEVGY
ncbi:MAG: carbohydrate ABC transporter permease, partial [Acutalibacteraceae bacterium]